MDPDACNTFIQLRKNTTDAMNKRPITGSRPKPKQCDSSLLCFTVKLHRGSFWSPTQDRLVQLASGDDGIVDVALVQSPKSTQKSTFPNPFLLFRLSLCRVAQRGTMLTPHFLRKETTPKKRNRWEQCNNMGVGYLATLRTTGIGAVVCGRGATTTLDWRRRRCDLFSHTRGFQACSCARWPLQPALWQQK